MKSSSPISQKTHKDILHALNNLIQIVAKLRSPSEGCPWDLAQTHESLIPYILEEAYEVVDAIKCEDKNAIIEELGDLLLQVVLQAQIATDNHDFTLAEIAETITAKLIRRHPHVFGEVVVNSKEEVNDNWEKIKEGEKKEPDLLSDKLKIYARSMPTLMASSKISKKSAKAGFEWDNVEGVWEKFQEELIEFQEAIETGNKQNAQEELGDLLFTIINLARWYKLDPTIALQGTNQKFIKRIRIMEKIAIKPLEEYTITELESFWQSAKKTEATPKL